MERATVSMPSSTFDQKVYKAKVVFVGIDRKSGEYTKQRKFNVNGNEYMVQDGAIHFLPEEALSALQLAVEITSSYKNKHQATHGIDGSDPTDKFLKIENKKYDITILGTYTQGIVDGTRYFIAEEDPMEASMKAEAERKAKEAMRAEVEKEIREQIEAEKRDRMKEFDAIPEATDDEEIDKLLKGE